MKELLQKCLKAAGKIQKDHFEGIKMISHKENISNIVTEVDFECNSTIVQMIVKEHPDHNLLTEEEGWINNQSAYTWVVDPLDGTSNYVAWIPWFGVLIALLKDNEPVLGGAYLPIQNDLYFAEKGKGAYKNGGKLKITDKRLSNSLSACSTDFNEDQQALDKAISYYGFLVNNSRNIRSTNSLLDFLYVAENKYGCCVNMFTHIWDIAAPFMIIKEAGGSFQGQANHEIDYSIDEKILVKNYPVIAGMYDIVHKMKHQIP